MFNSENFNFENFNPEDIENVAFVVKVEETESSRHFKVTAPKLIENFFEGFEDAAAPFREMAGDELVRYSNKVEFRKFVNGQLMLNVVGLFDYAFEVLERRFLEVEASPAVRAGFNMAIGGVNTFIEYLTVDMGLTESEMAQLHGASVCPLINYYKTLYSIWKALTIENN